MTAGQSEVESVIRKMGEDYVRHFNTGDIDQMVSSYYAEDASLLPPNHPVITGRAQIREAFMALREQEGFGGLSLRPTQITSSGDFAYAIGAFSLERPTPDTGKYLEVWRQTADGSWKCVADMFSSDQPAS